MPSDLIHFELNNCGVATPVGSAVLTGPAQQVVVHIHAPGQALWDIQVDVDGRQMFVGDGFAQFPSSYLPFEGIDIGIDRRSPVSWAVYQRHGAFPYSGHIHSVTYDPKELAPDAREQRIAELRALGTALE